LLNEAGYTLAVGIALPPNLQELPLTTPQPAA
jgi:hypothetical protein